MKIRFAPMAAFALLSIGAIAQVTQDAIKLEWKPKAGMSIKYKFKTNSKTGGTDAEVKQDLTRTVKEIKANGNVVIEEKSSNMTLVVGGTDMTDQIGETSATTTVTMSPTGEVVEKKGPDSFLGPEVQARLDRMTAFIFPKDSLKIGQTWTEKIKGESKSQPDVQKDYKLMGTDTVGKFKCYKISCDAKETGTDQPITMTTITWLSVDDGTMVKVVSDTKNLQTPYGPSDSNTHIDRVE